MPTLLKYCIKKIYAAEAGDSCGISLSGKPRLERNHSTYTISKTKSFPLYVFFAIKKREQDSLSTFHN